MKNLHILNYTIFLFLTCISWQAIAEDKAIITLSSEHLKIDYDENGFSIVNHVIIEKELLEEDAQAYTSHSIHYSETWNEIKNIESYVLRKKGTKYKQEVFENVKTKSNLNNSIFYDDSKFKQITAPKLNKGDKIYISYDEVIKEPRLLTTHFFSSFIPSKKSIYKVSFPDHVEVGHNIYHSNKIQLLYEKSSKKGVTTISWIANDLPAYEVAERAPDIRYYEPHLSVFIKSVAHEGKVTQILGDVDRLFDWYNSLVKDVNQEESKELKLITDSLTTNLTSDKEKIKTIFYWVQDNIKYVAFEDGLGGFIPREAEQVCERRFGDCKDMSSILTQMLEYANIEAYLTWVGSRDLPYTYEEMPTPSVDNHMIASVKVDGQFIFLDATGSYIPYGDPSGFTQGKEALIKTGSSEYEIQVIPTLPAEKNSFTDISTLKIADNQIYGTSRLELNGLEKFNLTHRLIDKNDKDQLTYLNAAFRKGHNKFLITEFEIQNLANRDLALDLEFDFTIQDYVKFLNDKVYLNLNLTRPLENFKLDLEKRKDIPVEFDHQFSKTYITQLELSDQYSAEYIPEKMAFENEYFGFSTLYQINEGFLEMKHHVYLKALLIEEDLFNQWNDFIEQLNEVYNEAIILQSK